MNKVAAVVVTYNRKELLEKCISALFRQDNKECDVIVIDNNSSDGTKELIDDFFGKRIIYYNTGRNLGGAGGFNYGIKKAVELGYEYIWLMDDDCVVNTDSLSKLLLESARLNNKYGFLCSRVLWKDGSMCRMNIPKVSYTKKITNEDKITTPVIMATFVSFFIRTDIVKEVGLPIKDFFIWADDLEYSRRISKNAPGYYVYDSVVNHYCKNNIGSNLARDPSDNLERYHYAYRNEYYLYKKEGIQGKLFFLIKRMVHRVKIILGSDRKAYRLSIINQAIKEGRAFDPEIERME